MAREMFQHGSRRLNWCPLQKKIADLASIFPLYLDGPAFAVFDQMEEEKKKDTQEIERVLLDAFGMNAFQAYDNFRQRTLMSGEPVDVYLSELRRLARLAKVENDDLLRCAFVVGLPEDVWVQLRASVQIFKSSLSTIVVRARVLVAEKNKCLWNCSCC